MQTTKLGFRISATEAVLDLAVCLDGKIQWQGCPGTDVQDITVEFDDTDDESHVLEFVLSNKTIEHTKITDQGEIISDVTVRIQDISFDDIKLDLKKGDPFSRDLLPKRVTALETSRVRIRGYILPSFQQTGLTQFVLVRDNMECCFGPGALLHDCVVVRMIPGKTASFSIRPVAVTGTFRVEELRGPDGRHLAIYALDGETVE